MPTSQPFWTPFAGLRSVEIRHLQWQHIDFINGTIDIRRSKTAAHPALHCLLCVEVVERLEVVCYSLPLSST